ncbi:hypothetical protein, partial [Streptomyces sp. NRRL F-6492]|uniref:hypothetical protein n=1 Tax=Streptomyces sp. NRRL F-6492 TaxID=1519497 RepID=UPI001F2FE70D
LRTQIPRSPRTGNRPNRSETGTTLPVTHPLPDLAALTPLAAAPFASSERRTSPPPAPTKTPWSTDWH